MFEDSMASSPAFQLYVRDFLIGVMTLSNEEVGAYTRLLLYQWDTGCIPDDPVKLARILGVSAEEAERLFMALAHKFVHVHDGCWRNERLENERKKQAAYNASQQRKAQRRWNKGPNARAYPAALPRLAYAAAMPRPVMPRTCSSSSSSSSNKEKTRARANALPAFFQRPTDLPGGSAAEEKADEGKPPTTDMDSSATVAGSHRPDAPSSEILERLRILKNHLGSGCADLQPRTRAFRRARRRA
jgi:uncharacterized protein YdaU (DUF1376 family)